MSTRVMVDTQCDRCGATGQQVTCLTMLGSRACDGTSESCSGNHLCAQCTALSAFADLTLIYWSPITKEVWKESDPQSLEACLAALPQWIAHASVAVALTYGWPPRVTADKDSVSFSWNGETVALITIERVQS